MSQPQSQGFYLLSFPPPAKNLLILPYLEKSPPSHTQNFYSPYPHPKMIFSCSHCSCTTVLISYSLDTKINLILILIDVLCSQKAVFSFEKGWSGQNYSFSSSHHPVKKSPTKISDSPTFYHYSENPGATSCF